MDRLAKMCSGLIPKSDPRLEDIIIYMRVNKVQYEKTMTRILLEHFTFPAQLDMKPE